MGFIGAFGWFVGALVVSSGLYFILRSWVKGVS